MLLKDLLYPPRCSNHVFHGATPQLLYLGRQWTLQGAKECVDGVTLSRFLIARVQSLGEFFRLASELHYFFGAFF